MRRIQGFAVQVWRRIGHFMQWKGLLLAVPAGAMAVFLLCWSNIPGFAQGTEQASSYKYYKSISIEKGDTLWSIAEEYMTEEYDGIEEYIREVRRVNHLSDDIIYAGRYLAIPCYGSDLP